MDEALGVEVGRGEEATMIQTPLSYPRLRRADTYEDNKILAGIHKKVKAITGLLSRWPVIAKAVPMDQQLREIQIGPKRGEPEVHPILK